MPSLNQTLICFGMFCRVLEGVPTGSFLGATLVLGPLLLSQNRITKNPMVESSILIGYTLWLFNIAMGNSPFIDGLPIKNGDFPWLC